MSKKNLMNQEYINLIENLDKTLSMLRGLWMESRPPETAKYMDRINAALDERGRLMLLRNKP